MVAVSACVGTPATTQNLDTTTHVVATLPANVDPPAPSPGEKLSDYMVRCYEAHGILAVSLAREFPQRHFPAAAVMFPGTNGTRSPEREQARQTCEAKALDAGLLFNPEDPEQVTERYRVLVDFIACLQVHDFPVPVLPSEAVFIENKGEFNPFSAMGWFDAADATQACPNDHFGIVDLRGLDVTSP